MNIQWTLALRYLLRRRQRMVLTTLAVVFGVMVIFGLNGLMQPMMNLYQKNIMVSSGQVDLAISHISTNGFDPAQTEKVRNIKGVQAAAGTLSKVVILPVSMGGSADSLNGVSTMSITGLDLENARNVRSYPLASGEFIQTDQQVLLPESMAKKLNLSLGDEITIPAVDGTEKFTIIGLIQSFDPAANPVYLSLSAAQRLLNMQGQINSIEVLYSAGSDHSLVEKDIQAALGDDYKLGALETGSELYATLKMGNIFFQSFGMMALLMGGFVIFNTFRTVVAERRRDLGMLRAIGATRRTVLGMIMVESLIQGVIGTVLGLAAGWLLSAGLLAIIAPIARQYLFINITGPEFSISSLILSIVMGIGITVASGWIPALSAARITPLEALRPELGTSVVRKYRIRAIVGGVMIVLALFSLAGGTAWLGLGLVFFLVGLVLVLPALVEPVAAGFGALLTLIFAREGKLAQGNLLRQPGRAAITASAMMIGLMIVTSLLGMMTSLRAAFMSYLDSSLNAGYLIMPSSMVLGGGNVGAGPELARKVRDTEGIAAIATLRTTKTEMNGSTIQLIGIDPVSYSKIAGLDFSAGNEEEAFTAMDSGRALVLNGVLSASSGLKIGDTVSLATLNGQQTYRVVGVALDYLNAKLATAYISQKNLAEDFHQTTDVLLMAKPDDGADPDAVMARLDHLLADYPSFSVIDSAKFAEAQKSTLDVALGTMYVLLLMVAIPGLIAMVNTLSIGVLERTREIGMLRAVGSTQKQIRRLILVESLLLAGLGTAVGILAGLYLGYVLVSAMNAGGFKVDYFFPYLGVFAGLAVGLLLGVMAASVPARQAAKMEIISALRYE